MKTKKQENRKREKGNSEDETLADLVLTDEQANQAKGGPLNYGSIEYAYKPQKESGT